MRIVINKVHADDIKNNVWTDAEYEVYDEDYDEYGFLFIEASEEFVKALKDNNVEYEVV